ncbi:MAG: DUF2252 domain-containing protein [Polyangiales bacterium]
MSHAKSRSKKAVPAASRTGKRTSRKRTPARAPAAQRPSHRPVDVLSSEVGGAGLGEVIAHFTSKVPSVEERMAQGKALRKKTPHARHAEYRPARDREDPVDILEAQATTRLKDLVPVRYARMLASPFAFLRGSAAVMAADLARTPTSGLVVQACGDMHVANFGVFATAERNLVFGINDFDETLPGPWEWDLKRLAASAVVAGRFLGADRALCEDAAQAVVRSYRKRMREYAEMGHLAVWYSRIDERAVLDALSPEARIGAERIMNKARQRNHLQVLEKMTEIVDDAHRIVEQAPLVVRATVTEDGHPVGQAVDTAFQDYLGSLGEERKLLLRRYRIADVARKVVGVGSVGTRCWIVLMTGNGEDDPLFLQYKEAQPSVLAPYVRAPGWSNQGQRVVVGQRIIQGAPDILLGWGRSIRGSDFYVRQLRDMKGGVDFEPGVTKARNLPEYAKLCGWALALAHAKSSDPAVLAGYLGKKEELDEAIAKFARSYADQTERDHHALEKAAKAKRIAVAQVEGED